MTPPETPNTDTTGDLANELRELGKNLAELMRNAWASEERKKLQGEIEIGLADLGAALNKAGQEFSQSDAAQNIKTSMSEFRQQVESGEVGGKIRSEILAALQAANAGLRKASEKQTPAADSGKEQPPQA